MSPDMLEVFESDGRKYVSRLRTALGADGGSPDADGVRRSARRLQHAAVLAQQEAVVEAATVLQKAAVQIIAGKQGWSDDLVAAMSAVVAGLESVIDGLPDGDPTAESRLRTAAEALAGHGTRSDEATAGDAGDAAPARQEPGTRPADEERASPTSEAQATDDGEAEAELSALIDDLGDAVDRLENDPRDREPLKAMLRRIRRLRELGRIETLSAADKALSAVEELILQIADLNATVGPGYLTVFRHAREVLQELRAGGDDEAAESDAGSHAADVDRMKDRVMETARRARMVIWVSDLFYEEGPPIVECPLAEKEAGSPERYFLSEATQRLDRSESLRQTMLTANTEQMRLAGESLAHTLRHLRERAVAFDHPGLGRVTRRAAAALRAQLVRPPSRLKALADGFGDVFTALRNYLELRDKDGQARAVEDAEAALHVAILGGEPELPLEQEEFDPDKALQQALALRTRVDERLQRLRGPEAQGLKEDLEELFDLIAYYVSVAGARH